MSVYATRVGVRSLASIAAIAVIALGSAKMAGCDYDAARQGQPAATRAPSPTSPAAPDTISPQDTDVHAAAPDTTPAPSQVDPIAVDPAPAVDLPLLPPPPEPTLPVRPRRRMDVDQLSAALTTATGGFGWTKIAADGTETDLFQSLSATLGKPDFVEITQEDLSPSPLFHKFLDEAARTACTRLMEAERAQDTVTPVLMTVATPDDRLTGEAAERDRVNANLSALLFRFHGRRLQPTDAGFDRWSWLFASTMHIIDDSWQGWRNVCVALILHPDFYTY